MTAEEVAPFVFDMILAVDSLALRALHPAFAEFSPVVKLLPPAAAAGASRLP